MDKKAITIGSRESVLAVTQSEMVIEYLKRNHRELEIELVTMKTTGDKILDKKLDQIGGKGLFVKELEAALRDGRADFCVHSLKDVPMEIPEDLPLVCFSDREDPRDVLVLPQGCESIDFSKPIGTSSARRILQLKKLYPEAKFESVRGNLQTRLRKLDEGQYSALILAAAGMKRLGLEERISRYFEVDEVIPAAGQGILAVQGSKEAKTSFGHLFEGYTNQAATAVAVAERAFVTKLDGGCSSPIAAHAKVEENTISIHGLYVPENTEDIYEDTISGPIDEAQSLGEMLAVLLKEREYNEG